MRAIYAFHTKVRGWNDIGYNFLVDRFGRVFEGRRGSITAAVVGAHTGGFNSQSLGVAVLGTFTTQAPSAAALSGLVDVLAWKAAQYGLDPRGLDEAASPPAGRTPGTRPGSAVPVTVLSSHRDVGITECPGDALYADLPWLRRQVAARMTPGLVAPAVSAVTPTWAGTPPRAGQRRPRRADPADLDADRHARVRHGAPVRVLSGTATSRITASWNLRNTAGAPGRAGPVPPHPGHPLARRRRAGLEPARRGPADRRRARRYLPGPPGRRRPTRDDAATRAVAVGRVVAPAATTVVLAGLAAAAHRRGRRRSARPRAARAAAAHRRRRAAAGRRRGHRGPARHPRRRRRRPRARRDGRRSRSCARSASPPWSGSPARTASPPPPRSPASCAAVLAQAGLPAPGTALLAPVRNGTARGRRHARLASAPRRTVRS